MSGFISSAISGLSGAGFGNVTGNAFVDQLIAVQGPGLLALAGGFRSIGPIQADVTVEELHRDELIITEHPIEYGAAISDHAYKVPANLRIKAGWSPSGSKGGFAGNNLVAQFGSSAVSFLADPTSLLNGTSAFVSSVERSLGAGKMAMLTIYSNMLALQASATPMVVITGKRLYTNMLIRSVWCQTDQETENSLLLDLELQQVIIVQTQVVSLGNASTLSNPAANQGTTSTGSVTPQPTGNAVPTFLSPGS